MKNKIATISLAALLLVSPFSHSASAAETELSPEEVLKAYEAIDIKETSSSPKTSELKLTTDTNLRVTTESSTKSKRAVFKRGSWAAWSEGIVDWT